MNRSNHFGLRSRRCLWLWWASPDCCTACKPKRWSEWVETIWEMRLNSIYVFNWHLISSSLRYGPIYLFIFKCYLTLGVLIQKFETLRKNLWLSQNLKCKLHFSLLNLPVVKLKSILSFKESNSFKIYTFGNGERN